MTDSLTYGCKISCPMGFPSTESVLAPTAPPTGQPPLTLAGQTVVTADATLVPGQFGSCRSKYPFPPCAPSGSWTPGGSTKLGIAGQRVLTTNDSFACTVGPGTVTVTQPVTNVLQAKP